MLKRLRASEVGCWLKRHHFVQDEGRILAQCRSVWGIDFLLPKESRSLAYLSLLLEKGFSQNAQRVLNVGEMGVWVTEEWTALIYRLLKGYGDERPLSEVRGFQFDAEDSADFRDWVRLALTSGWDFQLCGSCSSLSCIVSHDGWIGFYDTAESKVATWLIENEVQDALGMIPIWTGQEPTPDATFGT